MLDSLFEPLYRLATDLWWDYQHFTVDKYYERVTRESLQYRLRSRLLDGNYNVFIPELRRALWEQNALRRVFDHFAAHDEQTGQRGEFPATSKCSHSLTCV